jgi:hypothetical protein
MTRKRSRVSNHDFAVVFLGLALGLQKFAEQMREMGLALSGAIDAYGEDVDE